MNIKKPKNIFVHFVDFTKTFILCPSVIHVWNTDEGEDKANGIIKIGQATKVFRRTAQASSFKKLKQQTVFVSYMSINPKYNIHARIKAMPVTTDPLLEGL